MSDTENNGPGNAPVASEALSDPPQGEEDWLRELDLDSLDIDQIVDPPESGSGSLAGFQLPAKATAISACLVALISLTTLVIVTAAEGADGLSTIALALAVLAFVVQIIVFIYQSQTAHQQMLQSGQIYNDTRALLTEVRTAANSTEALVREQFRDLVKALMDSKNGKGVDERLLAEALSREGAKRTPEPAQSATSAAAERMRIAKNRRIDSNRHLRTFPDEEEGSKALKKLMGLTPEGRNRLLDLLRDEIQVRERGGISRLGLPLIPVDDNLKEAGLTHVARIRVSDGDVVASRLSDEGRAAARLLFAAGDIPDYAAATLQRLSSDGKSEDKGQTDK